MFVFGFVTSIQSSTSQMFLTAFYTLVVVLESSRVSFGFFQYSHSVQYSTKFAIYFRRLKLFILELASLSPIGKLLTP
jgi:hypothetical protein